MVQPKYSPEEALERIKLMMNYDSSKTLNENKKVIFEEEETVAPASTSTDANTISLSDLIGGEVNNDRSFFQFVAPKLADSFIGRRLGVKGVVDALDPYVDVDDLNYVLAVIKKLDGKCYYDDVDEVKITAIEKFIQLYSDDENEDLVGEIESVGVRTLPAGASDIKRRIVKEIEKQKSQSCGSSTDVTPVPTPVPTDGGNTGGGTGGYKDCSGSYSYGCKSPVIAKVQECLGGLVADGKFGPKTQAALKAKGFNSFSDADVDKICGSTETETDEFTTAVDVDNVEDLMNS